MVIIYSVQQDTAFYSVEVGGIPLISKYSHARFHTLYCCIFCCIKPQKERKNYALFAFNFFIKKIYLLFNSKINFFLEISLFQIKKKIP